MGKIDGVSAARSRSGKERAAAATPPRPSPWRRLSLRWRLAAAATAVTVGTLAVLLILPEALAWSHLRAQAQAPDLPQRVAGELGALGAGLETVLAGASDPQAAAAAWVDLAARSPASLDLRMLGLAAHDSRGDLLAAAAGAAPRAESETGSRSFPPGLLEAAALAGSASRRDRTRPGEVVVAVKLAPESTSPGYLVARVDTTLPPWSAFGRRLLHGLPGTLLLLLPVGLMVGVGLGLLATRDLLRRLRRLGRAAEAWSAGDLERRVADPSPDELGRLAGRLDGMAATLEQQLRDRQELATREERGRVARELHDTAKQQIFSVGLFLASAEAALEVEPDRARRHLREARRGVGEAGRDLNDLILGLRPASLLDGGLSAALEEHARSWASRTGIEVEARLADGPEVQSALAEEVQWALLRVGQEALANVARHSGADRVELLLALEEPQAGAGAVSVRLSIRDEGRGIDPGALASGGRGLAGMRERLAELGGDLRVDSAPNRGTSILARCPLGPVSPKSPGRTVESVA